MGHGGDANDEIIVNFSGTDAAAQQRLLAVCVKNRCVCVSV